jgi:hypothetical protein
LCYCDARPCESYYYQSQSFREKELRNNFDRLGEEETALPHTWDLDYGHQLECGHRLVAMPIPARVAMADELQA